MNGSTSHFRPRIGRGLPKAVRPNLATSRGQFAQGYEDARIGFEPTMTTEAYLEGYETKLWELWHAVEHAWEALARRDGRR